MRGADTFTESLFTMRHFDGFVPADHPLRVIRVMVNKALANMDELFARMYAADIKGGRPSITPEKLRYAILNLVLYGVRSTRSRNRPNTTCWFAGSLACPWTMRYQRCVPGAGR